MIFRDISVRLSCAALCSAAVFGCSTIEVPVDEIPPEEPFGTPILTEADAPAPDAETNAVTTVAATSAETNALVFVDRPSPNFNERTSKVNTILLHYTAGDFAGSLRHLTNPLAKEPVSSHYLVDRDGTIYRLVDESKRAWHAGAGSWQDMTDINSASIGIEIVNCGRDTSGKRETYRWRQITSVIRLCQDIQSRHEIRWVLGHSDTGLGRKDDPGEHFPWRRLANAGVGIWTDGFEKPVLSTRAMLSAIGYDVRDMSLATVAFQRHFYPEAITSGGTRTKERMAAVLKRILDIR